MYTSLDKFDDIYFTSNYRMMLQLLLLRVKGRFSDKEWAEFKSLQDRVEDARQEDLEDYRRMEIMVDSLVVTTGRRVDRTLVIGLFTSVSLSYSIYFCLTGLISIHRCS
jgi:hypothetical protein